MPECKCKTAKVHGDRHIKGELSFPGAKGPGSESSRERIGQGPTGRFAPGSELARERKVSVCRSYTFAEFYFLQPHMSQGQAIFSIN